MVVLSAVFESADSGHLQSFSWLHCAPVTSWVGWLWAIILIFLSSMGLFSVFSEQGVGWLCMLILSVFLITDN